MRGHGGEDIYVGLSELDQLGGKDVYSLALAAWM